MKTLIVGFLAFIALFFLAAYMITAKADEVMVYKLTLDYVPGNFAISNKSFDNYNPYEDWFTLEECNHKSAEITIALNLDYPPSCVSLIVIRQQG